MIAITAQHYTTLAIIALVAAFGLWAGVSGLAELNRKRRKRRAWWMAEKHREWRERW